MARKMKIANKSFEQVLKKIREVAKKNDLPYEKMLSIMVSPKKGIIERQLYLNSLGNTTKIRVNKLIELYRPQFYEDLIDGLVSENVLHRYIETFHEQDINDAITKELERRSQLALSKRHGGTRKLKSYAIELYEEKKDWKSVRQAARIIYPKLVEKTKGLKFRFSEDRGEKTVYEWLLKHRKITSARTRITSTS